MILCEQCQKEPPQLQGGWFSPDNGQWVSCKACDDLNKVALPPRLDDEGAPAARSRLELTCDFAKAIEILRDLQSVANLGDFIYDVREREGKGWEGPNVTKWSDAVARAEALLAKYSADAKV